MSEESRNPDTVPKPNSEGWGKTTLIGSRVPRVDGYERVSGSAIYPSDVVLPDMLYGAVLRCPWPNAKVVNVDTTKAEKAADALRLTARDLHQMKVVDELVPEPPGGAHRDPAQAAEALGRALRKHLGALRLLTPQALVEDRYRKFRSLGVFAG